MNTIDLCPPISAHVLSENPVADCPRTTHWEIFHLNWAYGAFSVTWEKAYVLIE